MSKKSVRIPSLDHDEVSRHAADLDITVAQALRIAVVAGEEELRRRGAAYQPFVVRSNAVMP